MGFFSSLSNAVSSACNAVKNAISSVCGSVSKTFDHMIENFAPTLRTASIVLHALSLVIPHPYLRVAVKVIDTALMILGLMKKDETTEDLGDRVLQAYEQDIKPADFSSYDDYIATLRNFKLDPEKSKGFSFAEKIAAGMTLHTWGLEQHMGIGSGEFLAYVLKDAPNVALGKGYFNQIRVEQMVKDIKNVGDVVKYFNRDLDVDRAQQVEQALVKIEQALHPDKSIDEIYTLIDEQKKPRSGH